MHSLIFRESRHQESGGEPWDQYRENDKNDQQWEGGRHPDQEEASGASEAEEDSQPLYGWQEDHRPDHHGGQTSSRGPTDIVQPTVGGSLALITQL